MAIGGGNLKSVVAIVLIMIASGSLYWVYGPQGTIPLRDRTVLTIDIEDHKVYEVVMKKGDKYPLKNPDTGKHTLWKAFASVEGKFIFPGPAYEIIPESNFTQGRFGGATINKHKDWSVKIPEDLQP